MKIWLVVHFEPIPGIDGNVRPLRIGYLANALVEAGHKVVIWTSDFNHFCKQNRYGKSTQIQLKPGLSVQLLYAPPYKKNVSLARIEHNRVLANSFQDIAESRATENPDIIFVSIPTLELAEEAVDYGNKNKIPVIVDIQDTWPDVYLTAFPDWLKPIIKILLTKEFRRSKRILESARAIVAVSNTYLKWGLNRANREQNESDQVFTLGYATPNMPDSEINDYISKVKSAYGIQSGKFIAIFLGQFGTSYDVETLVYAAKELQKNKNIQFILAGDGEKMPLLKEISNGITNIIFTGWVDQPTSVALLKISSLGLCAYSNKAVQSLPYKPFEYMAYGLPLLSSLDGELKEIITTNNIGKTYIPGDVTSLVKEIIWLVQHPLQVQQMSENVRHLFDTKFKATNIYSDLVNRLESIT